MRKKIVAANWKMNLTITEGLNLIDDIVNGLPELKLHQLVIFCCPFTHLDRASQHLSAHSHPAVHLGAQNCNDHLSGAYTGEISVQMLNELGVDSVIIGHSERRQYFNESHELLKAKVDTLLAAGKHILFCCGEPLPVRESGKEKEFVATQLKESLFHLDATAINASVTIAYEPIWAIGTGVTASSQQAQDMHAAIRALLAEQYDEATASAVSILYGGSCNASNAAELFACPDVDGGLIGGAALKAETFLPIVRAMI